MRMFSAGLVCLFITLPATASTQDQAAVELDEIRLSEGMVVVRHNGPQPTNLIAIDSDAGIVAIDTGISGTIAEAMRRRVEEIFGRTDFAYVINTHDHGDHTYGNQAFADVTIVGHEGVPAQMEAAEGQRQGTHAQINRALSGLRTRLEGMDPNSEPAGALRQTIAYYELLEESLGEAFRLTPPNLTFLDRATLELGNKTLELVFFGKAHSDTDILVYCQQEGLLATGDLFTPGYELYIDSDRMASIPRWLETLTWALDEARGIMTVVPAHGDPLPREELTRILDFVSDQQTFLEGKSSALHAFKESYEEDGLDAGLRRIEELKALPEDYYFFHAEFDSFVYRLMLDDQLDLAIPLFESLATLFPEVPNAFDSLGEAYLRAERTEDAATAFAKCLELDPEHGNARTRLDQIRG